MPTTSRRDFFRAAAAAYATGFLGLRAASALPSLAALKNARPEQLAGGYGPLLADPAGLLDLPEGFTYTVLSTVGDEMSDGLLTPDMPDGMAAFPGPDGLTIVTRNHELNPNQSSAFGPSAERLSRVDRTKLYDAGAPGSLPHAGGVSTLVFDTKTQKLKRHFMTLAGTQRNCAGGPTPWGAWITCEETTDKPGAMYEEGYTCAQEHGYAYEVPATAEPGLCEPKPLRAMGRFRREAVAVDPETSVVYQTEDVDDGAFYRFVPNKPGDLAAGGRLQALAIDDRPSLDTRNWNALSVQPRQTLNVRWVDLDDPEAPNDDLRYRAYDAGGARFARAEGIWWGDAAAYFACTTGGKERLGQIWRYTPTGADRGTLELFLEPNNGALVENADNLTAAPWGDLIVCEDRKGPVVRLVGVTPEGRLFTLANNNVKSEWAGVCFSPDGTTLFVNLQTVGKTVAITGPWHAART